MWEIAYQTLIQSQFLSLLFLMGIAAFVGAILGLCIGAIQISIKKGSE